MVTAYTIPQNSIGVNGHAPYSAEMGSPYIKSEEDDFSSFGNSGFMNMPQQFQQQQFHQGVDMGSVNPNDLTMTGNMSNAMTNSFGNSNLSGSFLVGKSNIPDDELLDLGPYDTSDTQHLQQTQQGMFPSQAHAGGVPMSQQQRMQQMYSHTPDGAPIISPFQNGGFDYSGFGSSMVQQNGQFRKVPPSVSRQASDRSPMTPRGHSVALGTPESMPQHHIQRQNGRQSGQWDGTPGSGSWNTPAQSPHQAIQGANISEMLHTAKHASLPAKVEGAPTFNNQEAKRRRRRESHNLVERRRRDNINERIQDLSKLVPQHRLEDEKIRKHITANGPLSPGIAAQGLSPPQATSMLASSGSRRAAGGITQGLPPDEKDKGPNKGDILNSSVSWTRDLMWLLNKKIEQEKQIRETFAAEGRGWPFAVDEDEKRMITELTDAVHRNSAANFIYSRCQGSGLRVPRHTNYAGEPLQGGNDSPQSLSPGLTQGGSGAATGGTDGSQFWIGGQHNDDDDFALKEEDEMEMNLE